MVLRNSRPIWKCTIGFRGASELPDGCDLPMRQAVREAFFRVTGQIAEFVFSGWDAELDEAQLAFLEGRPPKPANPIDAEVERQLQITRERFEALRAEVDKLHASLMAEPRAIFFEQPGPADEVFDKRWRELTRDGTLDSTVSHIEGQFFYFHESLRARFNPPEHVLKALDAVKAQAVAEVKRSIVARWNGRVER